MDIKCIRLSPYRHDGRLLLDVQQLIPLPEAAELTVRLKKREAAARVAKQTNRDLTKYVITTPAGATEPLAKRNAVLAMVRALHEHGVPAGTIAAAVPGSRMRYVEGELDGEELWASFRTTHNQTEARRPRWFVDDALHENGRTWVLFSNWGLNTVPTLTKLKDQADGFDFGAETAG